jgi:hypothetical protein
VSVSQARSRGTETEARLHSLAMTHRSAPPARARARILGALVAWLLAAVALSSLAPSMAQAAPACKCADKRDVENRIKEAKAAIAEYKNQIAQHGDEHHPFRYGRIGRIAVRP